MIWAALQAPAPREAQRPPDSAAGDRVMGQGISAVTVVVVPIHLIKAAPHRLAAGVLNDQKRLASALALGRGLLAQAAEAATMAGVRPPRGRREHTRPVRGRRAGPASSGPGSWWGARSTRCDRAEPAAPGTGGQPGRGRPPPGG